MAAKYEVRIELDITAYVVAENDEAAIELLSSEVENLIKGNGDQKMDSDIEIGDVDLQDSEAEPL